MKPQDGSATAGTQASEGARSILDAAAALFSRDGFGSVSIAQIAEFARVSKANVFHHFRSKDALYCSVIREAARDDAEFTENLLSTNLPSAEKLRQLVAWELTSMRAQPARQQLLMREIMGGGCDQSRGFAREVFRRNFSAKVRLFVQGQENGAFRRDFDPADAATMLGATCLMYVHAGEILRGFNEFIHADDSCAYGESISALMLRAIAAPKSAPRPASGPPRRKI